MADFESVKEHFTDCINLAESKDNTWVFVMVDKLKDALELLKGFKKIKEQLEELRIIEDSKIKECDSYCDWEAKKYHQGRFDAYSIALAGFEHKDGEK